MLRKWQIDQQGIGSLFGNPAFHQQNDATTMGDKGIFMEHDIYIAGMGYEDSILVKKNSGVIMSMAGDAPYFPYILFGFSQGGLIFCMMRLGRITFGGIFGG